MTAFLVYHFLVENTNIFCEYLTRLLHMDIILIAISE